MASARKRPRPESEEKDRAECPFSIRMVDPKEKEKKKLKRRRTDGEDDTAQKVMVQLSPFTPTGKFKSYETMDLHYQVEPGKSWTEMTRYNSFVLNGVKYFSEGFIYVANESTMERQTKGVSSKDGPIPLKKTDDDWVARILEIRASDEHHVYARIYWMYWPDEIPAGSYDGKKSVQGRQPYHGKLELIASNHMDIINVVSVTSPAEVTQWFEENDEEVQGALYWRQALDVRTNELSSVDPVCKCRAPQNPDNLLIGCTSESCKVWLHLDCLKHEALVKTYERLGTDKPHRSPAAVKEEKEEKEEEEEKGGKRPLSPKEPGVSESAHHSIDVRQDAQGEPDAVNVKTDGDVKMKQADDEDAAAAPEDQLPAAGSESKGSITDAAGKIIIGRKRGRPSKKPGEANGTATSGKPYEGLFEATLHEDQKPPMFEITDLRTNVAGGEKSWMEPIECLACGTRID